MEENKIKESADEKIRKELIDFLWKEKIFLQEAHSSVENSPKYRFVMDAIAWLEKQNHDGKKWIYEDVYLKEKEQLIQDGIDEVLENPQKYGLEKQGEQNHVEWNREDEQNLNAALSYINDEYLRGWLKDVIHIKYDKLAWSEEDEYLLGETIQHLEELIRIEKVKHCSIDVQYYQRDIDWLESLKQRLKN